jgi:hypothetical protein
VNILSKIIQFPTAIGQYAINTLDKYKSESRITRNWETLTNNPSAIRTLKKALKEQSVNVNKSVSSLPPTEQTLIRQLKQKMITHNRNNITRTKAYLDFYIQHPEVQWALLAHLVSRNGGWNMTDLKGELTEAISNDRKKHFFQFLESANALIFYDAYPQLLLYEESKKQNKNLFHLLPYFHVSRFMIPVWNYFYKKKDSKFLTVSLIINEQHYIEMRVIQNQYFQNNVLNTLLFQAQELFQFTQVLFPYKYSNKKTRLAGISVANFASVSERILVGKQLYAMLFGLTPLHENINWFATETPHTGSRSDYWSTTFTAQKKKRTKRTSPCGFTQTIYSPYLTDAWQDTPHTFANHKDWFQTFDSRVFSYYNEVMTPDSFDITTDYCRILKKLYVGALTYKQAKKFG